MPTDADLLRQYAENRDEIAFSQFVRSNVDMVFSAAFRQTNRNAQLAQDITQLVFVAAGRKASALARHAAIAAWLYQTTRYVSIDAIRSHGRRKAREEEALRMNEVLNEPAPFLEWDRAGVGLDEMIDALGSRDRAAVVLRFFKGHSFAQIGEQTGLSEGAARMRVERALEKLRIRLKHRGVTSSAAAIGVLLAEGSLIAAPAGLEASAVAAAVAAPAGGALSGALGALKIMTTAKIAISVATAAAIVGVAAAIHEYRTAQAAEKELVDVNRSYADARRELASKHNNSNPTNTLAVQVSPPRPNVPSGKNASPMAAMLQLLSNPAMQRQTSLLAKMRLNGQYGPLFQKLNLAPDQVDQFKSLLVEKEMVGFDSMAAAHDQGIDGVSDPRGFFEAVSEAEKTVDSQISSLLGPDGFSQFQQYQATIPARNTGNLAEQALSYTATPLTSDQAAQIINVMAQNGTPPLPPSNPFGVLNGDLGIIKLNDQGKSQLQGILSPPQLQALENTIQQTNQLLQARIRMGR
jgi:RNA polymerase sigma factor (sigma-70 family)